MKNSKPVKIVKVNTPNSEKLVPFTYKTVTPEVSDHVFVNCVLMEEKLLLITRFSVTFFDMNLNQLNQLESDEGQIHKEILEGGGGILSSSLANDSNSILLVLGMIPVSSVFD